MKYIITAIISCISIVSAAPAGLAVRDTVQGFDVSHYQNNVDFTGAYNAGLRFVMIKATESTDYIDPKVSDILLILLNFSVYPSFGKSYHCSRNGVTRP